MRNTKLFKIFINFFDRANNVSALTVTKKTPNFLSTFSKSRLNFNDKFKLVSTFINKLIGFNFYEETLEKKNIVKGVSGLFCPGQKERLLLSKNMKNIANVEKLMLQNTMLLHTLDYCFKLYGNNSFQTIHDFIKASQNLLTYSDLNESPFSYPLNHSHNFYAYFPFKQHLFVSNFAGSTIPISVLKDYYKDYINFSLEEYANCSVGVINILEYGVYFLNYEELLSKNLISCIAINADKMFMLDLFKQYIFSVVGQPHSDLIMFRFICKYVEEKKDIPEVKTIPCDVKLKANPEIKLPLLKGQISISPKLDFEQYFKRFLGDLKGVLAQKKKNGILSVDEFTLGEEWVKNLDKLIKSKISLKEKQSKFEFYHNHYLLHDKIHNLIPGKIVQAPRDFDFEIYYKIHKINLNKLIYKYSHKIQENSLFNGQQVNKDYIHDLLLNILQDWAQFDPDLGKKMLNNFLNVKKLFILDDDAII